MRGVLFATNHVKTHWLGRTGVRVRRLVLPQSGIARTLSPIVPQRSSPEFRDWPAAHVTPVNSATAGGNASGLAEYESERLMCGITGAAWTGGVAPLELGILERMTTAIAHRGPDDAGYYHSRWAPAGAGRDLSAAQRNASAGTARRRAGLLAIAAFRSSTWPAAISRSPTKTARSGSPSTARSTTTASCNRVLNGRGTAFGRPATPKRSSICTSSTARTASSHLRGMFAFAIWDERRDSNCFWPATGWGRSRWSIASKRDRLLFASELKALLQVPGIPRELNPVAVNEYLTYQYVPHPHSILKGFQKLPPAHWAVVSRREIGDRRGTGRRRSRSGASGRSSRR